MQRDVSRHLPLRPVEFHILLSLAAGERHGYGIIQDIQERGDAPVPDVGTMYRALARMVEAGLIEAAARRPARRRRRRAAQLLPHHRTGPAVATRGGAAAEVADAGRAPRRTAAEGGAMMSHAIASSTSRSAGSGCCSASIRPTSATTWATRVVDTYRDRAREALAHAAAPLRLMARLGCAPSSTRCATAPANGVRPAGRGGAAATGAATSNWRSRRLMRAPLFAALDDRHAHCRTGHGRRRLHGREKVLIEPMPYRHPGRSVLRVARLRPDRDITRGRLAGTDIVELRQVERGDRGRAALQPLLGGIFSLARAPIRAKSL